MISAATEFKNEHPHYQGLYARYLESRQPRRILELGVASGASLKAWLEWFPEADVVGVDNRPDQGPLVEGRSRCAVYTADQCDADMLDAIVRGGRFDLIVDDAGHDPIKQALSLALLWPSLNPGGLYVVEDLETSFWPLASWNLERLGENPMEGWENPAGVVNLLNLLVAGMTAQYAGKSPERFPRLDGLTAVHHHKNIVFLEKA